MSDQLMTVSTGVLMPVMDLDQAKAAYTAMVEFVKSILRENTDFGTIPGTPKPTLYKPGAEKLNRFFGLGAKFDLTKEIERWDDAEPFFSYRYKCSIFRLADGALVAEGEGSCNSHEGKYRYRTAPRVCPECGKAAIIKGKQEYGGGWVCFKKKDGCGAKYPDSQFTGEAEKMANPDIADQVNTMQKMAQKRAFIAATLIACNASEFFTQDIEDLSYGVIDGEVIPTDPEPVRGPSTNVKPKTDLKPAADKAATGVNARPLSPAALRDWFDTMYRAAPTNKKELLMDEADAATLARKVGDLGLSEKQRHAFSMGMFGVESTKDWSEAFADTVRLWLKDMKSARTEALAFIESLATAEPEKAA